MPRSRSPAPPARSSFAPLFAITEAIKRQPGAAVRRSRPAQGLFALLPRGGPAIP
jgi:hypothetical protein